jgi:hypothetical protein
MSADPDDRSELALSGLDRDGHALLPGLTLEELAQLAMAGTASAPHASSSEAPDPPTKKRSQDPREGIDPRRLDQAGWGVIFAADADPAVHEALEPLLHHRRRQATRLEKGRFRDLHGSAGYRPGESKRRFLARHGVGPGPADPDRMPYYLLLVGDPEAIPFAFQTLLDVQYAVGRIAFASVEDYARYAAAVVGAEQGAYPRPRRAVFFSPRKDGDAATEMIHDLLVEPLARGLARHARGWEVDRACREEATHHRLGRLLGGTETPALLFTGCHGLGCRPDDPRQRAEQGALVCQQAKAPPATEDDGGRYFTAASIGDDACPGGLIAFSLSCFGAGTPRSNEYAFRGEHERSQLADAAFVAALPQRLLAHPRGGALAMVGHVDRAWSYSFAWPGVGRQIEVYASALRRLLAGHPLGSAMEFFNQRYAELTCELEELRQELALSGAPAGDDLRDLVGLWTSCHDNRSFVVLGDPAVRLAPLGAEGGGAQA